MKKIINAPEDYVAEVIDGVLLAHPSIRRGESLHTLRYLAAGPQPKVAIVTGGGSGHMPLFAGYLGDGLIDGAAVGQVFASPSAEAIYSIAKDVDRGQGILFLYGNYSGDRLNFERAALRLTNEGVQVASVRAADDVASGPASARERRRGIAGIALLYKIAGAVAREGKPLDHVVAVTQAATQNLATMGVALSSCIVPEVGKANFEVAEGEMEIGMGLHGEPGVEHGRLLSADRLVDALLGRIYEDLEAVPGDSFDILVNSLGATPQEELYIMFRRCVAFLQQRGGSVRRPWIGQYATSMEMTGASISLLRVDEERARLLDAPVSAPMLER